ncbi:hypothetical protein ACWF9G_24475 [Nocardia sp. NPDC055029]
MAPVYNPDPQVAGAITAQGFTAQTITIAGWLDTAATILAFLHVATRCEGLILHATARRLDPTLPAAWVTPENQYLQALPIATEVEHASIWQPS